MSNTIEKKTVKKFIELVLLRDIGRLISTGNHYLGFGVMAQAIELLGAIVEDEQTEKLQKNPGSEFHTTRKSRARFRRGLELFQNPDYLKYCPEKTSKDPYDLYDNLRCGYAHQLRPQGQIAVTTEQESKEDGTKHLEIDSRTNNLILVSERLYHDLEAACKEVIRMIDSKEINHRKAYSNFLNLTKY